MRCRRYEGADCHVEAVLSALWFIYHLFRKQGCPPQVPSAAKVRQTRAPADGQPWRRDTGARTSGVRAPPPLRGGSCIGGETLIVALVLHWCLVEAALPSLTLTRCGQPAGSFLLADSRCLVSSMIHSCQKIKSAGFREEVRCDKNRKLYSYFSFFLITNLYLQFYFLLFSSLFSYLMSFKW